ncbi:MAG: signal peptidase I [Tissierellales bacterium]
MRKLSKIINIILCIIVAVILLAAITSVVWQRPVLFSSVNSNSMYPLLQRGDMILIRSLSNEYKVNTGDMVVFSFEEGSLSTKGWIVHRVIGGNEETGYVTKGDANNYTDQTTGANPPVKREWIVSKVMTIGDKPLRIPLIGYIPLWIKSFQTNPNSMPIIAVILVGIVGVSELINSNKRKKKKKRKKGNLELQLVYFFGGLTITIIMGATMLATSQRIPVAYEVSEKNQAIIMGSNVGIIRIGEEIEKSLSELSNKGFFPIIATITSKDEQITFSHQLSTLKPSNQIEVSMQLKASKVGKFNTLIHVGMFYPFLPSKLIYILSLRSYWLALIIISLIPGLPLMLYPFIDRSMRKKTIKKIRRLLRRIHRSIPMFN